MAENSDKISVTIVTPHGKLEEYDVTHLRAPGSEGYFGVLPGHLPLMTSLQPGAVWLDTKQGRTVWAVSGGYIEVLGDQITILAETAERSDRIDLERARAAKERALGRIAERRPDFDIARARLSLVRSITRLKVAAGEE